MESVDYLSQQIRYYALLPVLDSLGSKVQSKITILIITTDYIFLVEPANFIDTRKDQILQKHVLFKEKLQNLVDYKVMKSPEQYLQLKGSDRLQQSPGACFLSLITAETSGKSHPGRSRGNLLSSAMSRAANRGKVDLTSVKVVEGLDVVKVNGSE